MSSDNVETSRDEVLYELIAPELGTWERTVRDVEPLLSDAEVLDRALRQGLAHLRLEVAQQTLRYLSWRAEQAKASARATVAGSAAARQARAATRQPAAATDVPAPQPVPADMEQPLLQIDEQPCTFRDRAGCFWIVQKVTAGAVPWAKGTRFLLFDSESAVRRVWRYPPHWRSLSEVELEALSWRV